MPNPSYYAIIPANIRYHKSLTANEKIIYCEITALASKEGYCWATNKYFATLYGVSTRTITRWIAKLFDLGFISVENEYLPGTQALDKRKISIVTGVLSNPDDTDVVTPYDKSVDTPLDSDVISPLDKNVTHNNIKINNTRFNNTRESSVEILQKDISSLIDDYHHLCPSLPRYTYHERDNPKLNQFLITVADTKAFFQHIEASDFLSGRSDKWQGCSLLWLIRPNNIQKILGGAYDNPKAKANPFFEAALCMGDPHD